MTVGFRLAKCVLDLIRRAPVVAQCDRSTTANASPRLSEMMRDDMDHIRVALNHAAHQ
jgi:hypothetical protein